MLCIVTQRFKDRGLMVPVVPVVPVVPEPAMEGPPEGAAPGLEVDQVGSQPSSHWTTHVL